MTLGIIWLGAHLVMAGELTVGQLVAFNMLGALLMIVLEKRKDIAILKSLGASEQMVWKIFILEGILMSAIGLGIGLVLAVGIYVLHTNLEFGLISIPQGSMMTAYPSSLRFSDVLIVSFTVIAIGTLASLVPASKAKKVITTFSLNN